MTHPHRLNITTSVQRSRHPPMTHPRTACIKRPATSVVVPPHDSPRRGASSVSHTKTLMERASSRNQLSPLPKIGEGLGEWSEAPSYEEGVGVDGGIAGFCLQWGLGGNPQWVKTHIFATFSKKVSPSLSQSDNGVLQCRNFVPDNERVWI